HFLDRTGVERRTGPVMQRHLNLYQAVRNLSRVFTKVGGVPIRERPCFPVRDIADCLVEVSTDAKRPDFSLKKPRQNGTHMRRNWKIKSRNQAKRVADGHKKKNKRALFPHKLL